MPTPSINRTTPDENSDQRENKKVATRIKNILGWVLVALFVGTFAFIQLNGIIRVTLVAGESMEPTYYNGDVIISIKQESYAVDDVIVYHPDIDCDRCNVVHRIIAGNGEEGWKTQGDNNNFVDVWHPTDDGVQGKIWAVLPLGGFGIFLTSTAFWSALLVLLLDLLAVLIIWEAWNRGFFKIKEEDKDNQDDQDDLDGDGASSGTDETSSANNIITSSVIVKNTALQMESNEPAKSKKKSIFTKIISSVGVITLAMVALVSSASATSLLISSTNMLSALGPETACTIDAVSVNTVSEADNHVRVNGIPDSCLGLNIRVGLVSPDSLSAIEVSGTVDSSDVSFTSGSAISNPSTVTAARVNIKGFNIPASWDWVAGEPEDDPIVPPPSSPFTVAVTYTQTVPQQICANIVVATTSATPIGWTAQLRIAGPPFNGDTNASHYQFSNGYQFQSPTPVNGHFTIIGTGGNATVVAGVNKTFSVCNYGTPPPFGRMPGVEYHVSVSPESPAPGWYVCQTVTVTTTGATQFFVGWDATIDLTAIANAYKAQSGQNGVPTLPGGEYGKEDLGNKVWRVWGVGWNTSGLKDGGTQSFPVCWGG